MGTLGHNRQKISLFEHGTAKPIYIMSTLNYSWNVRGTLNGNFVGASGTTASVDGVAEVHGTAGEGAPFDHSSWIWAGMAHYGLGWMKGGHKVNPCGGTATRRRAPGLSRPGPNTPSLSPRATTTSGTEPPSNSNSTTAPSTPATGKWTSTSENPWTRCPTHTLSSSGPRPGIPSPTTGTSTKERKSNSLHTTRSNRLNTDFKTTELRAATAG